MAIIGIGLNSLEFPSVTQNIQVGFPVGVPEPVSIWINPSNSPALGANHVALVFNNNLHPGLSAAEMRDGVDLEIEDPENPGTYLDIDLSSVTPYLAATQKAIIYPLATSLDSQNDFRCSYTPGTLRSPVNELVEAFSNFDTVDNDSDVTRAFHIGDATAGQLLDTYVMSEAGGTGTPRIAAKFDNGANSKDMDATVSVGKSSAFTSGNGLVFTGSNLVIMDASNGGRNSEYDKAGASGPPDERYSDGKFTIAWRVVVNTLPSLGASGDTAYWWEKWTGVGSDRSWTSFVQSTGVNLDVLVVSGSNASSNAFSLVCSERGVLVAGVIYAFVAVFDPDNGGIVVYSKRQDSDDFTVDDGALSGPGAADPEVRATNGTRHLAMGRLDDRPDITGTEIDLEGFHFYLGACNQATAEAFCNDVLNHPFNPA